MAIALTSTGLVIDTFADLQNQLTTDLQQIYGQDINTQSDTPDGEAIGIYVQVAIDNEEVYLQGFNSFDPDNAVGILLDQRVAINGIQREQGTFTITNVAISVNATVTLFGLDQEAQPVYTVTDNVGSMNWQLQETVTLTINTTTELAFQAAETGAVLTVPGTIRVPVTVVIQVTNINNDEPFTSLGTPTESDAQLKIRRQQSTAIGSQGYYNALTAALQNIPGIGVGNVKVYENDTAATSTGTLPPNVPSGIPSHSIWVVVGGGTASESTIGGGAGANAAAIAQAIYEKRNAGCGMLGSQSFAVTQADGSLFPIFWDVVSLVPIFINFTVGSVNGTKFPNIAALVNGLTGIPALLIPGINQTVNANQIVSAVQQIDPNTFASAIGFSLTTSGFTATLSPAAGDDQFQVVGAKIIITPMIMTSTTAIIAITVGIPLTFTVADNAISSGPTIQYSVLGGYSGAGYTWTIAVNNSGGTISPSGLYTPGAAGSVQDTLQVEDTLSNVAQVVVTVA
jgi:hypothetical protein